MTQKAIFLVEKWDTQRVIVLKIYEVVVDRPENPSGVLIKVNDGKKECWVDGRDFAPLDKATQFLYEEYAIKNAQIETLKKDLKNIYDRLKKMALIKNK